MRYHREFEKIRVFVWRELNAWNPAFALFIGAPHNIFLDSAT
jgi:hypothetical protein